MKRILIAAVALAAFGATALASQTAMAALWQGSGWFPTGTFRNFVGISGRASTFAVGAPIVAFNEVRSTNTTNDTFFFSSTVCTNGIQYNGPVMYGLVANTNVSSSIKCPVNQGIVQGGVFVWQP